MMVIIRCDSDDTKPFPLDVLSVAMLAAHRNFAEQLPPHGSCFVLFGESAAGFALCSDNPSLKLHVLEASNSRSTFLAL